MHVSLSRLIRLFLVLKGMDVLDNLWENQEDSQLDVAKRHLEIG